MLFLPLPLGTTHHICSSYPSSWPLLNKKLQEILKYTVKRQNKCHTRLRYPNNTTMITLGKFKKHDLHAKGSNGQWRTHKKWVVDVKSRDGNSRNESKEMLEIKTIWQVKCLWLLISRSLVDWALLGKELLNLRFLAEFSKVESKE